MAVLVILMSNLPVYETKKAEELQAGVLHTDITWVIKEELSHTYNQGFKFRLDRTLFIPREIVQ